jgi:ribosomal subunit interface protein
VIDMQTPIQITYRGLSPSDAIEQNIQKRAARLERFRPGITACHVTVELPHQHHHQGNLYRVHVDLHVPGGGLVVTRGDTANPAYEDAHVVIRDAFDAAERRLEERQQRTRHRTRDADQVDVTRKRA